jgi:hypothetical protein
MTKTTKYTYHIDLDERGLFMAHVENSRGRVVVSYDLPAYSPYCVECGNVEKDCTCENFVQDDTQDWDIFSDWVGVVKHNRDIDGLERHYKDCGIMPQGARLVMGEGTR